MISVKTRNKGSYILVIQTHGNILSGSILKDFIFMLSHLMPCRLSKIACIKNLYNIYISMP
jgi:hypothetical protein